MAEVESRRYAADAAGVLHEITDYRPRSGVYVARCEALVPARSADVLRGREPPGVLCRACRYAVGAAADP